jgi:hypothetical protein
MTKKTTTTVSKFSYTIEPRDGGFVGVPSDPKMGTVDGATREDVQQKISAKVEELVLQQIPRFPFSTTVTINRTGDAPDLTRLSEALGPEASRPLRVATGRAARIARRAIGALIVWGLWYYIFQR